jgi:uncharacterized protein
MESLQTNLFNRMPSGAPDNFLITGATGFIGQKLVRALLADGQRVTVLSRDAKRASALFEGGVTSITSMADLPMNQVIDVIINLAGARILGWRWSAARRQVLLQSRIATTHSLVEWIARAEKKPRLLLSASAIGYYGVQAQGDHTELGEDSPAQSIFMSTLCQEWEATAHQAAGFGVAVKCMRFGVVLGQQGALPMMLLPIKLGIGGPLGSGEQWQAWIHINDLIRGIAFLLRSTDEGLTEAARSEAYNFTAPECLQQKQFAQIAAGVLHRPSFMPTPAFPMRIALGEQADLLLEGQRVVPKRILEQGFTFTFPDLKSALEDILK